MLPRGAAGGRLPTPWPGILDEAGVADLVEHHAEESQTALPRLLSEGYRFDLAVVDGNHRFDAVFLDLVYLGQLLRPGKIVFLDDYHLQGVARAASFFLTNLVGLWKRSQPTRSATTGPSCAQVPSPTPEPSTTSAISDQRAQPTSSRVRPRAHQMSSRIR